MTRNRSVRLAEFCVDGMPTNKNLEITDEEIDVDSYELRENQILVNLQMMSVDPYMRFRFVNVKSYFPTFQLGQPLQGHCVGKVVKSKNSEYVLGDFVVDFLPWSEYSALVPVAGRTVRVAANSALDVPLPYFLGVLGMPGMTAYLGFHKLCLPKEGETLLVTSAAGAVGQIVGQLGKKAGLKVVGVAGSEEKCRILTEDLHFDHAINYKEYDNYESFLQKLESLCPDGVDCCFENVGGYQLDAAIAAANPKARFAICGQISQYNISKPAERYGIKNAPYMVTKELVLQGFLVSTLWQKYGQDEAIVELLSMVKSGSLVYNVDETSGDIGDIMGAFNRLFTGANVGKQVFILKQ